MHKSTRNWIFINTLTLIMSWLEFDRLFFLLDDPTFLWVVADNVQVLMDTRA
jgi:hypothetical protein